MHHAYIVYHTIPILSPPFLYHYLFFIFVGFFIYVRTYVRTHRVLAALRSCTARDTPTFGACSAMWSEPLQSYAVSDDWESSSEDDGSDNESSLSDSSSSASDESNSDQEEEQTYEFYDEPSRDIYCPVTLAVMLHPCQTRCCGNHLSLSAARRLKRMKKRCPLCKTPLKFVEDKYFQRVVLGSKIYCSKKEAGCTWVGELRDLKLHLNLGCEDYLEQQGRCGFVEFQCPYKCGDSIQRHKLENHKTSECLKRPFSCPHCTYAGTYESITGEHWSVCKKLPIQCPNECSSNTIERRVLKRHLNTDCPQQEVECEFSYSGCTSRVKRCKLTEHNNENLQQHLLSLAKYTHQLHMHTSSSLSQSREIVFRNFKHHLEENCEWYSPPFYSHIGGYKMCLGIDANGFCPSLSNHLGVALYMMKGEFDSSLQWPFKGVVTIELVNHSTRGKNYTIDIVEENSHLERDYKDIFSRVTKGDRSEEGWGFAKFISHKQLLKPTTGRQYLDNNSLIFRVSKVVMI